MDLRQSQILFFRKFAHLYDSGVPLPEALEIARGEFGEPLRSAVEAIIADLYQGTSLADAMERRQESFSPEIVGILRAGEKRGELGEAARSAASGLKENFLEPRRVGEAELEGLLEFAGDARFLHLEPGGQLKIRTVTGLSDGGEVDTAALGGALARRASIDSGTGRGAFVWRNRLVRVAITETAQGPSTVVRLSHEPGAEPKGAKAWREGRPGLLLVIGGRYADKDACFRAILGAFDERRKCVAVNLPVPEALSAPDLEAALSQDPDVVCVPHLRSTADAERLAEAIEEGVHVVAGVPSTRYFENVPHRVIRLL